MKPIHWRKPEDEVPNEGSLVAVLYQHGKQHNPMSCEIMFGITELWRKDGNPDNPYNYVHIDTDDMSGQGSWGIKLKGKDYNDNNPIAWAYITEFHLPDWTPHNAWWGPKPY